MWEPTGVSAQLDAHLRNMHFFDKEFFAKTLGSSKRSLDEWIPTDGALKKFVLPLGVPCKKSQLVGRMSSAKGDWQAELWHHANQSVLREYTSNEILIEFFSNRLVVFGRSYNTDKWHVIFSGDSSPRKESFNAQTRNCLLYTSPSPRD